MKERDFHSGCEKKIVEEYVEYGCCLGRRQIVYEHFHLRFLVHPPREERQPICFYFQSGIARCSYRSLVPGPKMIKVNIICIYDDVVRKIAFCSVSLLQNEM